MDGESFSGGGGRVTRRGLLALVGTSAVAGCNTLDGLLDGNGSTISAYDLPDVDEDAAVEPVVPEAIPLEISADHLDSARDRVTSLLAELPTPMRATHIPNGYVRKELTDAAGEATDQLSEARTAGTDLMALQALRRARERARYAAAGWAVANRGLTAPTLKRDHRHASADARTARANHAYVGADPVRATVVHAQVETYLDRAADRSIRVSGEGELLPVAEWGEEAESARAYLDDARHLAEQFTASLPADAGPIEAGLVDAAETLLADLRSRREDLPPEPTAEEWGVTEHVLRDLLFEADGDPPAVADGPARAIIEANDRLTHVRALDRIQDRIDAGEISSVESAAEIRRIRAAAYDALEAALDASPAPDVARTVVSDVSWRVSRADQDLARASGEMSAKNFDDTIADYLIVTAVARAAPAASRQTADALSKLTHG